MRWTPDSAVRQWRLDHGDSRAYGWSLCQRCGNGYPAFQPSPDLLSFFWNRDRQDNFNNAAQSEAVWATRRAASQRNAARTFEMFVPLHSVKSGRFLDIACGLGETVKYFFDRGWDAQGIDVDPALKRFHDLIGIRSRIGQIEAVEIDGKFDIIHISHAVYFITNPAAFLDRLKLFLKPDGLLCIVISNFLAPEDAGLPGYAHSFLPTAGSMQYALAKAGYEVVLSRKKAGSIYIAARPGKGHISFVYPSLIRLGYETKALRYSLIGRPKLWLYEIAKAALSRMGLR
ncbi:MAG: class I SAM-dependent methyltransferase [Afipia sp.]